MCGTTNERKAIYREKEFTFTPRGTFEGAGFIRIKDKVISGTRSWLGLFSPNPDATNLGVLNAAVGV